MVAKGDQVFKPLSPGRHARFERAPDAAVQLHASLHQEVLINDVLEQRLGEAELRLEPRAQLLGGENARGVVPYRQSPLQLMDAAQTLRKAAGCSKPSLAA